ncbi:type II toxin-antitoxin system HicB family antitoxin [Candidatus Kaiserbacteria bacterium]|nr:type II toxin-antitoxin system HicB family antitoxin [Candidatus Kaiserbacteria bacterium]
MAKVTKKNQAFQALSIEFDREEDGRWIAEIPTLPGVMAYGNTKQGAMRRVHAVALRTLADKVEQGNTPRQIAKLFDYEMARG